MVPERRVVSGHALVLHTPVGRPHPNVTAMTRGDHVAAIGTRRQARDNVTVALEMHAPLASQPVPPNDAVCVW